MVAAVMALVPGAASAVPIDITARSQLDVSATALGRVVEITGRLRDDLGRAIPSQPIVVRAVGAESVEHRVVTGPNGEIDARLLLGDGAWALTATWPGDPAREGVSIEARLEVRHAVGAIEIEAPQTATLDATWETVVRVTADGHPVAGVLVLIGGDCTGVRVTKTDPDAVVRVPSGASDVSAAGDARGGAPKPARRGPTCTFVAAVADSAIHTAATRSIATRIVDEATLTLAAGDAVVRLLRPTRWQLSGTVADATGPVAHVPVSLLLDGDVVGGVSSDGSGAFSMDWAAAGIAPGAHRLRARFEFAEGSGVVESNSVDVVVPRDPSAVVAIVALPVSVVCVLAFVAAFAALPRIRRRRAGGGQPAAASLRVVPGDPGIVLVDATTRRSIAGELVIYWQNDEQEHFNLDEGELVRPRPEGRIARVHATAVGYLPAELRVDAAVDRRVEVALVAFRTAVRGVLEEVAATRAGLRRGWWGRRAPMDVGVEVARRVAMLRRDELDLATFDARLNSLRERAHRGDHSAAGAAIEALAMVVERANFGGRTASVDDLDLARSLAQIATKDAS